MYKEYEESMYDLETRMFMSEAMNTMKQFKEGDYIHILAGISDYNSETDQEGIFFEESR